MQGQVSQGYKAIKATGRGRTAHGQVSQGYKTIKATGEGQMDMSLKATRL